PTTAPTASTRRCGPAIAPRGWRWPAGFAPGRPGSTAMPPAPGRRWAATRSRGWGASAGSTGSTSTPRSSTCTGSRRAPGATASRPRRLADHPGLDQPRPLRLVDAEDAAEDVVVGLADGRRRAHPGRRRRHAEGRRVVGGLAHRRVLEADEVVAVGELRVLEEVAGVGYQR